MADGYLHHNLCPYVRSSFEGQLTNQMDSFFGYAQVMNLNNSQ